MEQRPATHAGQEDADDALDDADDALDNADDALDDADDDDDDGEVHHYGAIACYSFRLSNTGAP